LLFKVLGAEQDFFLMRGLSDIGELSSVDVGLIGKAAAVLHLSLDLFFRSPAWLNGAI
jgi:hypothetical protein